MRSLHLTRLYDGSGGCPLYLRELLPALNEVGHPTALVCAEADRDGRASHTGIGVSVVPELFDYTLRPPRNALARLEEIAHAFQPDLIHLHDLDNSHTVDACANLRPTVRTFHDYRPICPGGIRYYRRGQRPCTVTFGPYCLYSAYANWCNSRAPRNVMRSYLRVRSERARRNRYRRILVASRHVAELVIQEGYERSLVDVLPYFVPTSLVGEHPDQGESSEIPRILFLGRVAEVKGLDRLLRSLTRVSEPWELVVVGDGYSMSACRRLAEELGLGQRVRFLGWVEGAEKWRALHASSLVAIPSVWPEPFGIVGLEAMAAGKPVVAFGSGGIPEWLDHGTTGYVVRPDDIEGLAGRIREVLGDPGKAEEMGRAGRAAVGRRFGLHDHVTRLTSIYRHAIAGDEVGSRREAGSEVHDEAVPDQRSKRR